MSVKPIPEGYHTVTPTVIVEDGGVVLEFVRKVFDPVENHVMRSEDGTVRHAEVTIGDSRIMISTASEKWKPMPASLHVYCENIDALYRKALDAGATSLKEPTNEFYGDRSAGVADPQGNWWWLATHIEDVSDEEMERRAAAAGKV
jgi:uncharacterized glyoxalase superfamily protein PhnB